MIGAALVKTGPEALVWHGILKTVAFIFVSPVAGLVLGLLVRDRGLLAIPQELAFRRSITSSEKGSSCPPRSTAWGTAATTPRRRWGSSRACSSARGFSGRKFYIPLWVVLSCHGAIALGTMFGGWRIVKTMGQKVTKLKPVDGFCAESSAAVMLFISTHFGIPVSTTHTITGAIMGVGSLRRLSAVKWGVAGRIVWAWMLTVPCSAAIAAITYILFRLR